MWPYWLMFAVPALAAVFARPPAADGRNHRLQQIDWGWVVAGAAVTLLVGYRLEVGGDWFTYEQNLENVAGAPLSEVLFMQDPGYQLLSWFSARLDLGIYGVNVVCAAIFAFGLIRFCRMLPRPWLALAVAVPYLVIVVSMGYTRQAVALACGMAGIRSLMSRSIVGFVGWVLLAAMFHRTAVLLFPIAALVNSRNRYIVAFWIGVITIGAYELFLSESVENLYVNYIEAEYQSEGAFVRLAMNAVPALILLWRRDRFPLTTEESALWRWFALISVVLLGLFFATSSTTALDRVGLYMLPLQLIVFSHVPNVLGARRGSNQGWVFAVIVYYAAVQFVWLNFADHAVAWIPYRFFPLAID